MLSIRWRKVWRDLWGNKARTLLVVLSTAVGIFAFGTVASARILINRELDQQYAASHPASAMLYAAAFDDDFIRAIGRLPEVSAAEGRRNLIVRAKVGPDEWIDLQLIAIRDFAGMRVNQLGLKQGAWPNSKDTLAIESSTLGLLAAELGGRLTIETLNGQQREFRIVGLAHDLQAPPASRFEGPAFGYITFDALDWLDVPRSANQLNIVVAEDALNKQHIQDVAQRIKDRAEKNGTPLGQIWIPEPGKHLADDILRSITLVLSVLGFFSLMTVR